MNTDVQNNTEVKNMLANKSDSVNGNCDNLLQNCDNLPNGEKRDTEKPTPLPLYSQGMPDTLKNLNQWVLWKYELKGGKWTKPPKQPNGYNADTKDNTTWTDFDTALEYYNFNAGVNADGIGFVLTENLNIVGFDFDHCLDNSGNISDPKVREFVETLSSYTEISPSGKGLRVFAFGKLPDGGRKKGGYECYSSGRYLTLTGHRLPAAPKTIEHREKEIADVHHKIFAKSDKKSEK